MPEDEDTPVWYLEETNEFFNEYEDYLDRMDYYHERVFTCELTGTSHLTYFEALKCETDEMNHIFETFPEALKEPILRKVLQNQYTRMDGVVDSLYSQLRHDFFPGEVLIYKDPNTHSRIRVVIREKAQFPEMTLNDGTKRPATSRYRVETTALEPRREILSDDSSLIRDRRLFTKVALKAFLKHSIMKNPRSSVCPWAIKPEYAEKYRIEQAPIIVSTVNQASSTNPANTAEKKKLGRPPIVRDSPTCTPNESSPAASGTPALQGTAKGRKKRARDSSHGMSLDDDLSPLLFNHDNERLRPSLQSHELPGSVLGPLLAIWLFLNTYHEPLVLDPFTFDDLIWALKFYDLEDNECLLLSEIHCALLSLMVGTKNNTLLAPIPENTEEEEWSQSGDEDENKENIKREEEAMDVDEEEDFSDAKENVGEEDSEEESKLNGSAKQRTAKTTSSTYANYQNVNWTERLRKRMFKDGGWQQILIGLLHTVQHVDEWEHSVKRVLEVMASKARSVTLISARNGYADLSLELKVRVLEILCQLVYLTPGIRTYLDQSIEEVTKLRKDRAEILRDQKQLQDTASRAKINLDKTGDNAGGEDDSDNENEAPQLPSNNNEDTNEAEIVQKHAANQQAIMALDAEILEKDVQRVPMLGRDRFFNRYWWFEHNGVQTEIDGYGVGQLWVQGPSEEEARVYLGAKKVKVEQTSNGGYSTLYDTKVAQDELFGEQDWRFYDNPEQITELIAWLNPAGRRETQLLKELKRCQDKMVRSMKVRQKELQDDQEKVQKEIEETIREEFGLEDGEDNEKQVEEPQEEVVSGKPRRRLRGQPVIVDVQQRKQDIAERREELRATYAKEMPERVMEWTNSAAEEKFGQCHYEGNRTGRTAKRSN